MSQLVGEKLRLARTKKGWTTKELSQASDLALNTISLIERGKISPTVATLHRLSMALEVPLTFFFEEEQVRQVIHTKAGQREPFATLNVHLENLGSGLPNQTMDPFLVTLEPNANSGPESIVHVGHELVVCLEGVIEYHVAGETFWLQPGDSLLFEAHLPHRWGNSSSSISRILLIMQAPQGIETARQQHIGAGSNPV
jgi:transcriptional regulator with XRE-family HTH domain